MEYQEFVDFIKNQIKDYLPEKFSDAQVNVNQVVKNNDCMLDGLTILDGESNVSPTIYLNPFYEQFQDGTELVDILKQIAEMYQENHVDKSLDTSIFTSYDMVKDKIICKLVNEEENKQFLQNKPYAQMEDLAVVYQVMVGENDTCNATITITDNLMERYGVTKEELHERAMKNMEKLQPYEFKGMNETMMEIMASQMAEEEEIDLALAKEMLAQTMPQIPDTMFVLSNSQKINGASQILNDSVRQEIADKIGDFYVLPSSVHETLIIPKSAEMDVKELETMVQEVNATQVAPEERLSDYVYEYDAKEHELLRCGHAAERRKEAVKTAEEKPERSSLKQRLAEKKETVAGMTSQKKAPVAEASL